MAKNKGLMDFVMKNVYKGGTESLPFHNMRGYSGFTGSPIDDYNIGLGMQGRRSEDAMWDREWDYSQENYDNPERPDSAWSDFGGTGDRMLDLWHRDRKTPYAQDKKTVKVWDDAPASDFNSRVVSLTSDDFGMNPYWDSDEEYPGSGIEAQYARDLEDIRTKGYVGSRSSTEQELMDDYFRSVLSGRRLPHMTAPSGAFGQWSGYGAGSMPDENRMARYQEELDY